MLRESILKTSRRARERQEGALGDIVQVSRPTGDGTIDSGGTYTPDTNILYEGAGHLKFIDNNEQSLRRVDTNVTTIQYLLKVPLSAGDFEVGDTVRILRAMDSSIPTNMSYRVAEFLGLPWPTIRRMIIEQVSDRG